MSSRMHFRWVLLAAMMVLLLIIAMGAVQQPENTCMGVEILPEAEMEAFTRYQYRDYSEDLKFRGECVALDRETSTVYLPQTIESWMQAGDLQGMLELDIPGIRMFFAPDDRWSDLSAAVAEGHGFRLLVSAWTNTYMEYEVVFTTLPVLSLRSSAKNWDEEKWEVWDGRLTLWDPALRDDRQSGVHYSRAQWNMRGGYTRELPKKSWKLNLKDWGGKKKNADFLALGEDDDWILNPMSMEDSNVREMLFMNLWNEMAGETDYNYPMSQGEYVEVVLDQAYYGLFLLQRRIDDNYLNLPKESIVVKAKELGNTIEYEMRSGSHKTLPDDLRHGFFVEQNCENVNKENFVDVNLFLNLFAAMDNSSHLKNMYYVFDERETGTVITMIPWDTDISLGSVYDFSFRYDYKMSMSMQEYRREWDSMTARHPGLDEELQSRWFELRETVLEEDHMLAVVDQFQQQLAASGAADRDEEKWGLFFEGQDTVPMLKKYIAQRLEKLDKEYSFAAELP